MPTALERMVESWAQSLRARNLTPKTATTYWKSARQFTTDVEAHGNRPRVRPLQPARARMLTAWPCLVRSRTEAALGPRHHPAAGSNLMGSDSIG
jgi:hypothetical protein